MPRFMIPRCARCEAGALAMFGIAAIVAFAIALILQLASVSRGAVLTVATFTLIGLLCLSVHLVTVWWPSRRGA